MDEGCYNTYTISDSDDSVIDEGRRTNETSRKDNDCFSTEEEPEFFLQVLQRVLFGFYELSCKMMLKDLKMLHIMLFFF